MNSLDEEKKFYERFWALLGNDDLMHVFKRFGPAVFRRSSVLEGFERFIIDHEFCGKSCVEIGTLKGLTAIILARHFERVVTIDIIDDPDKREIARMVGVSNVEFITVCDNAEKSAIIGALEFGAAYVDGNHIQDTETDFALVRRGKRVLFHEYWDAQPAVMQLVAGLAGKIETQGKFALWTA